MNRLLIITVIATLCFGGSFILPFVCSNFKAQNSYTDSAAPYLDDPCPILVDGSLFSIKTLGWDGKLLVEFINMTGADGYLKKKCAQDGRLQKYSYSMLDKALGPIQTPNGSLDWRSCVQDDSLHQERQGTCCPKEPPLSQCLKWRVADRLGIPLGDQSLMSVIKGLFTHNEILLGCVIFIFSICFPLSKLALLFIAASGKASEGIIQFLKYTSKWSMTDVFVIGLLISFFRAETFSFQFYAGIGVYLFAAGALLSSWGITLIDQSATKAPCENSPDDNPF